MSTPRGFGLNGKSLYSNVAMPKDVNLQFTVTPTNGLGVTSLKSNGYVRNVFMHTSTTPTANDGFTNPNPAAGYAAIQFKNNFNYYLSNHCSFQTPTATSTAIDNAVLTAGLVYVITIVGDATLAMWQAVGLPAGLTPTVGQSFVALTTGAGGGTSTSRVQLPTTSGIYGVEVCGSPATMLSNSNIASNGGAWVIVKFMIPTFTAGAYTPVGTVAAPTFTGSPLATHTHDLFLKNGAVVDGTTTTVNAGANLLGANTGGDLTVTGGGANGGIVLASGGTPAGTNSAPAFTGGAASLTGSLALAAGAPATGTVISMKWMWDGSTATVDGI
ncbi:MAG: hypothetical protein V4641_09740 [Pseudomonadota bacterium]